MIFNVPRGGCLYKVLLTLLFVTACLPVSAQVLIGGTLYEKLDLFEKISGTNPEILYDGEYNGPYSATQSRSGDYSYTNIILNKQVRGKVIVKFDTYDDHLPKDIDFFVGKNGNGWGNSLVNILETSPNAPYMVKLDIPDGDFNSIQMRASSAEGKEFYLRELEVLQEIRMDKGAFIPYPLDGKLGSSNQNNNFNNLIDNDRTTEWGINWQITGVVPGEYASVKVDLGAEYTGYIHLNYTNGVRQAPTRLSFYGYNGDDWNSKDADTPNINSRWQQLPFDYLEGENLYTFLGNPDAKEDWKEGLYEFPNTQQEPGQTRDVVVKVTGVRYIMMRVYDSSGNPGSGYNGHIAGDIVAQNDRVEGIDYVSNFDLMDLRVERWLTQEQLEKYVNKFSQLGFTHTHGALSSLNDDAWGYQNAPINEESNWEDKAAAGIAERYGVQFPDFNYVGKTKKTLQATHEREYDVYVIPGHTVALIPYSDMHQTAAYGDGYIRWYDYDEDLAVDDKYFGYHVNPSLMWQIPPQTKSSTTDTEVGGSLGGVDLLRQLQSRSGLGGAVPSMDMARGCFAQFHVPADDKDFNGATVAADFSMSWGDERTQGTAGRIARANGMFGETTDAISVIEPAVNCRALFHIHDGRDFAREISESPKANADFIAQNRRVVSAAPKKSFNIRLDFKEPAEDGYHSNIYYLTDENDYDRVYRFKIRTFIGNQEQPDGAFVINNGVYAEGGAVVIPQMGYITEEAGKNYNRFLHCDPEVAEGGTTYTVKIYGLDKDGNEIKIAGTEDSLQIMEYVITFDNDTSMQEMTDYLKNLDEKGNLLKNPDDANLPRHTYQSLEERFGETYSMQTYDQYMLLANALREQGGDRIWDYFIHPYGTDGGKNFVNRMGLNFRYPIMWERCDYTFPFTVEEGWNHYSISNHSEMTSYKAGAGRHNYRGLLDVSFYMKHPELYVKSRQTTGDLYTDATYEFKDAGFFFFADAATDPGTVSRVVVDRPCPGTRIHVSAWVSEFGDSHNGTGVGGSIVDTDAGPAQYSDGNWANVIFNYRAKNRKTGEQKTIYTYVPGKVPDFGYWYHIYFNFIPVISEELINSEDWEYYISLESNAPSSLGADFAVDDIRIYLQKPDVNLIQLAPLCDHIDENANKVKNENVRILVEVPFEMLVRASGLADDDDVTEADFYFCAIDMDKYEKPEDKEKAIIPILESGSGKTEYGMLTFPVDYDKLGEYKIEASDKPLPPAGMKKKNDFGEDCMYFLFTVDRERVEVGKEIKFCVYVQPAGTENGIDPLDYFEVEGECAIHSDLRIQGAAIIKMDGVAVPDRNNIVCCENQRPVIQLTMTAQPENKEDVEENYTPEVVNACYDWFDGEYKKFVEAGLEVALSHFREVYPQAETYDMELKGAYTEGDYNKLKEYCDAGTLHLRQSFYIFPEYHIGVDEEGNKLESLKVYATAIPIYEEAENPNELLCLSPVEIPLTIRNQAPVMLHGLGIEYPATMKDVPLRVGLNQILNAKAKEGDNGNTEEGNVLWLPVRNVSPVTENVNSLVRPENEDPAYFRLPDKYVYLVGSNDPRYQNISPDAPDYNPDNDKFGEFNGLMEVGEVREIIADKNAEKGNFVGIRFDSKFDPREGYYYVLRYSFEENPKEVGDQYLGQLAPCYGEDVLTIKIVPEYQMWIGKDGDFNKDSNWRRVTSVELLDKDNSALEGFVTDIPLPGTDSDVANPNANPFSYAPMDFTKVIVPEITENGETEAVLTIEDLQTEKQSYTPYGPGAISTPVEYASSYGGDIKYDMAAYVDDDSNVQCKLWYHNTCEQIHFNFGAEMLNQGLLKYEKAWVDMDNVPGNWYYLSMPLMETFAGDFYLPTTIGAFQNTKLFEEIRFVGPDVAENQLHDRFKPAVYQRAWNKSSAKIFDKGGNTAGRDVAVLANWSRVYNDVTEKYAPETNPGFSVRTDVGYMDDADKIETVRFRFPKADEEFKYWDQSGENSGHPTEINRKAHYKLNPSEGTMTAEVAEPSKYFLIGNPFICHLDLQEFFKENEEKIESKCWILNNGEVKVIDESMFGSEDEPTAWRYLPPFQGFFVEALVDAKEIELSYTPEMMASLDGDNLLSVKDRTTPQNPNNIIVTMSAEGESDSQIRFVVGESSEAGDVAAIFNADSRSGMTAYGKSEGLASSIRYVDKVAREEVGVSLRGDKAVTIRFNGTPLDGLMLHDALTGNDTELYDGMEYVVEGSVAGRLFIIPATSDVDSVIALSDFSLEIDGARLTLTAPAGTGNIAMQVFDTEGRVITNVISDSDTVDTTLMPGTYVISAITDLGATFSTKILIRL